MTILKLIGLKAHDQYSLLIPNLGWRRGKIMISKPLSYLARSTHTYIKRLFLFGDPPGLIKATHVDMSVELVTET